jgi:hypothetical protein
VELPFSATCAGHGTDHGVVETESFDVAVQYGTYLGPWGRRSSCPVSIPLSAISAGVVMQSAWGKVTH